MKTENYNKLRKNNNGYGHFMYYINRPRLSSESKKYHTLYSSTQQFFRWRDYCWTNYGPSKEINNWLLDIKFDGTLDPIAVHHNEYWSWQNNEYGTRIYLKSDAELTPFLLVWF